MIKNIPNVDGQYETKDGSLKVTVTRKTIEIEVTPGQAVHIIDDDNNPPRGKKPEDRMDTVMNVMNKTTRILMG
jgi:hypothetical protein